MILSYTPGIYYFSRKFDNEFGVKIFRNVCMAAETTMETIFDSVQVMGD